MNGSRVWLVGLMAVTAMLSGCFPIRLPPLANYSLPKTNKVVVAACYGKLSLLSPTKQSKSGLSEVDQQKINYVAFGVPKALEKAGYQVTRVGCNEAWTTDAHAVKFTLLFTVWPYWIYPDAIELYVYLLPLDTKEKLLPIFHGFYGSPPKGAPKVTEVFPKIPPVLFKAIKIGQHNAMKMGENHRVKAGQPVTVGGGA